MKAFPDDSIEKPSLINFEWLLQHPARLIAFGWGAGLSPYAPGTIGTLVAWPIFVLLQNSLSFSAWLIVLSVGFIIGIWACERTGQDIGIADYSGMVWDEMLAFCFVLLLLPDSLIWQAWGFFLFRFFDIFKPPPIDYFDRTLKGGLGVMWDDLVAAFYTLFVIALIKRLWL